MAEQRVQVRKLDIPSGVQPVASPVNTYVKPALVETQPSELEQFLTSITPAFKADAEVRRAERIKEEQEIRSNTRTNQLNQMDLGVINATSIMAEDYNKNISTFKENRTPESDLRSNYSQFIDNYINSLGDDVSQVVKDAGRRDLQKSLETLIVTNYRPALVSHAEQAITDTFTRSLLSLSNTVVNDKVGQAAVKDKLDKQINANLVNNDLAVTRQKYNKITVDWAASQSEVDPFSPVIGMLQESGILNSSKFTEQRLKIEKNQNSVVTGNKKAKKKALEGEWNNQAATAYFDFDSVGGLSTGREVDLGEGFTFTPNNADIANEVDNLFQTRMMSAMQQMTKVSKDTSLSPDAMAVKIAGIEEGVINPLRQKYYSFYNDTGETPKEVSLASYALNSSIIGNLQDPKVADKLLESYNILDEFSKYGGNLKDKLSTDGYNGFIAAQSLVDNRVMDAQEAFMYLQSNPFDATKRITTIDADQVANSVDGSDWSYGLFKFTNKEEAINFNIMVDDVQQVAGILTQIHSNKSEQEILDIATQKVASNYATIKLPDGKFSIVNMPANSKKAKAFVEDIEVGLEQIISSQTMRDYIHAGLGIEPVYRMQDGTIANRSQLAEARAKGILPVSFYTEQIGFDLELRTNKDNPNLAYVMAVAKDGSNVMALPNGYINLNTYSEKAMNALKDSYVTTFEDSYAKGDIDITKLGAEELEEYADLGADTVGQSVELPVTEDPVVEAVKSLAPVVTEVEAMSRLYGANAARKTSRESLKTFMEDERNALFDRARSNLKNKGVEPEVADEATNSVIDTILESISNALGFSSEAEAAETEGNAIPSELSDRTFSDKVVDTAAIQGVSIQEKASNLIQVQEDFRANPYADGKNKSVGYGFYLPALEADERALITDVNNITETEAKQVMALKVSKITDFMSEEVDNFSNLPEQSQIAVISMGFQLGRENVRDDWPKFITSLRKAASLPKGSDAQKQALSQAATHMLFNVNKGRKSKTNWHKQTPNRANEMAMALKGM